MSAKPRQSTSMTIDRSILDEARALGLNISQSAESGLRSAIRAERERRWKADNAEAIEGYNARFADTALPLSAHRKF